MPFEDLRRFPAIDASAGPPSACGPAGPGGEGLRNTVILSGCSDPPTFQVPATR